MSDAEPIVCPWCKVKLVWWLSKRGRRRFQCPKCLWRARISPSGELKASRLRMYKAQNQRDRTPAEARVYEWLRARKVRFTEQKIFRPRYIADFYLVKQKLVLEVDGAQHQAAAHRAYDANRTRYLEQVRHVHVARIRNEDTHEPRISELLTPLLDGSKITC